MNILIQALLWVAIIPISGLAIYTGIIIGMKLIKRKDVTLFMALPELPYLASLMQLLFSLEDFRNTIIKREKGILSLAMKKVFNDMLADKYLFQSIAEIYEIIIRYALKSNNIKIPFKNVQDLLMNILLILESECNEDNEEQNVITPNLRFKNIAEAFETKFRTTYQCEKCNNTHQNDISVHFFQYKTSKDLLNHNSIEIDVPSMAKCTKCGDISSKRTSVETIKHPKYYIAEFSSKRYLLEETGEEKLQTQEFKIDDRKYIYRGHVEKLEGKYNQWFAAIVNRNNKWIFIAELVNFRGFKYFHEKETDQRFISLAILEKVD